MAGNRAENLLSLVGARPGSSAASGRYQRSVPIRRGVRYWATVLERQNYDKFGVQFWGEGTSLASKLERAFTSRGFKKQSTQPNQITFVKDLRWRSDGSIDVEAVRSVRREVDAVLNEEGSVQQGEAHQIPADASDVQKLSFREFMLNSPLAGVDLELPKRQGGWRDADL